MNEENAVAQNTGESADVADTTIKTDGAENKDVQLPLDGKKKRGSFTCKIGFLL